MIRILSADQLKAADEITISQQHIKSIDLMERAAEGFVACLLKKAKVPASASWFVFCGYGNNGGDGLAIARLLKRDAELVHVFYLADKPDYSKDFETNLQRLIRTKGIIAVPVRNAADFPLISPEAVIIDALFGSGLNKPLQGLSEQLVEYLSKQEALRVAVDIPSGLFADRPTAGSVFKAHYTISFHSPKLSFLFPENAEATGLFCIEDIGLSDEGIPDGDTTNFFIEKEDIRRRIRYRGKFDHKGRFGHAFIHAGSEGKMGAAILCARACAKTGAGLTTVHVPEGQSAVMHAAAPEIMTLEYRTGEVDFSEMKKVNAFAAGPGMGLQSIARSILLNLLKRAATPVLDADAINLLAAEKNWKKLLPEKTILTPHLKEFERLAGKSADWLERHQKQLEYSTRQNLYIVLKGAYTCITTPEGKSYFNPTGNPGMAKGGSGDVLTGMIVSLLAQQYSPEDACLIAVYLHGLAADIALESGSEHSLLASDIIQNIGNAFRRIEDAQSESPGMGSFTADDNRSDHDLIQLN